MSCRLSWCLIALLVLGVSESTPTEETADNLQPRITAAACTANATFYRSVRSSYESVQDFQYPTRPGGTELERIANHAILAVSNGHREVIPFYLNIANSDYVQDIFLRRSELQSDYFKWCIHLISPDDTPIDGCIKGENVTGTERFRLLGLLDMLSYVPTDSSALKIALSGEYIIVFQNALLVCTIDLPWLNHTIGLYYHLTVEGPSFRRLKGFPNQEDAFLVKGEKKVFNAELYIADDDNRVKYSWYHNGAAITRVLDVITSDFNCTREGGGFTSTCTNETIPTGYSIREFKGEYFGTCKSNDVHEFQVKRLRVYLGFFSASVNNTGEFQLIGHDSYQTLSPLGSFFVVVVFTEFPSEVSLPLGSSSTLSCALKAPSNATVYWLYNDEPIGSSSMNYSKTDVSEILEDNHFSMFYSKLKVYNITDEYAGQYSCVVEYSVPSSSEVYTARQDVHATVYIPRNPSISTVDGLQPANSVVVTVPSVTAVAFVLIAAISLVVVLGVRIKWIAKRKQRRTLKHRPSSHLLLKPHLLKGDAYIDLCSPDIKKSGELDFPRQNLELVVELGQGKFGKVFKAKAHGMVSSFPHINTVAVKTTLNSGSFNEESRLLNELELLKKLYRRPHKNICNLLGHCIETTPLYLILEFACYGNMKKYLVSCREAVQSEGQELLVDRSTIPASTQTQEVSDLSSQLHVIASATNPFQVQLSGLPVDSDDPEKAIPQTDSLFTRPGQIKETQLCDFAQQIASGLKHLADMNIIHCDLAARNILIAEKGVLKIGDFGMAREASTVGPLYQNLHTDNGDNMIPAKWAAPELLAGQPHSLRSDIWSYGVILWEIASYGSEPFSHFKLGVSLEPFLKYLQEGSKLAKPAGLSNYLYRQMCSCWSIDPNSRPCAEELAEFFQNMDPNTIALEDILEEVTGALS